MVTHSVFSRLGEIHRGWRWLVLLGIILIALGAAGLAAFADQGTKKDGKGPMMISFDDMNWVELPERKGMQFALFSGNPKKGAYTQMRKVPAGTDNPPHRHSSELKNVIISGVWYTGKDSASAKDFGPGSVVMMPANWEHVSGCRPGSDCVFYQEGKGKFDFKPVEEKASEMKPGR